MTTTKNIFHLSLTLALGLACSGSLFAKNNVPPVLPVGSPAPAFTLKGVDDKTVSLSDYKDAKLVVVVFTCNHCPDALGASKRLQAFHETYKDKGVQLIAISGNDPLALEPWEVGWSVHGDSFPEMKLYVEDFGWTFPYLYDGDTQAITTAYGAQATPHAFVLDGERKIRYQGAFDDGGRNTGPAKNNHVINAVEELLASKPVTLEKTRARGCSTKWSFKREKVAAKHAAYNKRPVTLDLLDEKTAKGLIENNTEKIRILNFWSTTCPPCVVELPHFVDSQRRYSARKVELITISTDPDDRHDKALDLLKKIHAPVVGRITKSLEAENRTSNNSRTPQAGFEKLADILAPDWAGALPLTLIIAPGGKTLFTHLGGIDAVELRREIVKAINTQ